MSSTLDEQRKALMDPMIRLTERVKYSKPADFTKEEINLVLILMPDSLVNYAQTNAPIRIDIDPISDFWRYMEKISLREWMMWFTKDPNAVNTNRLYEYCAEQVALSNDKTIYPLLWQDSSIQESPFESVRSTIESLFRLKGHPGTGSEVDSEEIFRDSVARLQLLNERYETFVVSPDIKKGTKWLYIWTPFTLLEELRAHRAKELALTLTRTHAQLFSMLLPLDLVNRIGVAWKLFKLWDYLCHDSQACWKLHGDLRPDLQELHRALVLRKNNYAAFSVGLALGHRVPHELGEWLISVNGQEAQLPVLIPFQITRFGSQIDEYAVTAIQPAFRFLYRAQKAEREEHMRQLLEKTKERTRPGEEIGKLKEEKQRAEERARHAEEDSRQAKERAERAEERAERAEERAERAEERAERAEERAERAEKQQEGAIWRRMCRVVSPDASRKTYRCR